MDRLLPLASLVVLIAAFFICAYLWNRRRLRKAEEAHRAEIEAFVDWLLLVETAHDREAVQDIGRGWSYGEEHAYVYLKRGGWFELVLRSANGLADFNFTVYKVGGRSLERFPPIGTRCRSPWFVACMTRLQNLIDVWPREWIASERASRVVGGRPDPLHVPHRPS